jgi:adenine/guanine/hypoxanthine permease
LTTKVTTRSLFCGGDVNGFLGLMGDNLANLSFLAGILIGVYKFPSNVIFMYIFPGTCVGVFLGNLAFTLIGVKLAKKLGRTDIAAMPLGFDAPSTIGLALIVIGPAFVAMKAGGMSVHQAALGAWYVGMAAIVIIGVCKILAVPIANHIQNIVPRAGLLGSLAGVGIALIGFMPLISIFSVPIVGVVSFGIILYTLIANIDLPKKIPGVFVAIVVGVIIYHTLGPLGWLHVDYTAPTASLYFAYPIPTLDFLKGIVPSLQYLPIIIPFAILVIVGNINVAESAVAGGDPYSAKQTLLVDGICTLIGGLCGSVAQTTAYVGQPAYKRMGSKMGYTLYTGLFIGLGGIFGYVSFFVALIPTAVLAPVLVFVALEVIGQGFTASPKRHAAAVALAMMPSVARYMAIQYSTLFTMAKLQAMITHVGAELPAILVTTALGSGFILSGMLWGAFLAELIDRRLKRASVYLLILSIFAFFGIVNSANLNGSLYLPWNLTGVEASVMSTFAFGYLILAIMFFFLSFTHGTKVGKLQNI